MKLKDLIKAPPAEGYIKNSSNLVTALFILAGVLYYPTNGYGAVIALAVALIVLIGQKMLIGQANKDFAEMQFAEKQFPQTQNLDYVRFIHARATQILNDNKVLSEKGKKELHRLLRFADATLAENNEQITPKTEDAIKNVLKLGIPFIPVSARPPYAITPYTEQLGAQHGMICYSGALILDKNLTALYSVILEPQDLQKLNELMADFAHLSISYYAGLDWFCNDVNNDWIKQESTITGLNAAPMPDNLTEVHKLLIMGDTDEIQAVEPVLKQALPHLSIHRSKNEYLEIMNSAATKAKAIQFMEQHLGTTAEQVIAFGDNFNDLDMLQYAGLSVAMGNAPDAVKQAAKEVTANNNEDGIALVLNRVFGQ
ncbi:Cof-type HAD-IIB family hydrolase [Aggregatibacter actinomycetemcomitans]|uniref:Cof-type HAD-IIB family hydrolase n=1 Tax=Aggregatibacter actinomycetemcomitans TaxID=714 RepID=UPI00077E4E3B|nr:Cof-type HAD-IIB family hydrolase [Aggregatibacter actinomycetemcomitans]KYK76291.1 COF family hydrolase [Aggregatibacter actinomycetemcomitans serotype e str. SA3096]KYK92089.1 COF family hydrolase [Aggregatibacter actinomycetemcomitans serotype e str. ANH9776]TYB21260.1 Cof-type HAD-IIB family hydrolase [Aggregatibacter actinomycetemcomitans]